MNKITVGWYLGQKFNFETFDCIQNIPLHMSVMCKGQIAYDNKVVWVKEDKTHDNIIIIKTSPIIAGHSTYIHIYKGGLKS